MKHILILVVIVIYSFTGFSQTFSLDSANNGTTQTTCSATLYDSGDSSGVYQNSEDYSISFCSTTGDCMQIDFTVIDMESGFDYIYVYDGNSITAPLLNTITGTTNPGTITSSGTCITIRITTDGSVQHDGFAAMISCTGNCYVPPPLPTNNDPCGADTLVVDTFCNSITTTTVSAINSGLAAPSCAFSYNGGDVWYQATVPDSGTLAIQLGAGTMTDAGIAIYSGPNCNNLTEILCDEQTWQMPAIQTVTPGMGLAGQTVWIRVWEPGNDSPGTFDICAYEPPPFVEVDTTVMSPDDLVTMFFGGCHSVSNVVYTGSLQAIGYFTKGNLIGFTEDDGIVLSSGAATQIGGPNTSTGMGTDLGMPGDSLLDSLISPDITKDASVLEFDLIPTSDTLKFDYIFGSEEYPEFVNSFNDVFGFFISGPNPGGGNYINQNIAVIPGTTIPVAINNINNGINYPTSGPCTNCQYYIDNFQGKTIEFDGYTTVLTTEAAVIPGEIYHLKLAVADAMDHILDSGVLLNNCSSTSSKNNLSETFPIKIFPNPSTGTVFIESPQEIISGITVMDFTGRIVKNKNCNSHYEQVDLKTETADIYFVTVITKNSRIVRKIILTK